MLVNTVLKTVVSIQDIWVESHHNLKKNIYKIMKNSSIDAFYRWVYTFYSCD